LPPLRVATAQASSPLDLRSALTMARQSGPLLRLAQARRDISVGRARELSQLPNPTVEWRRENLGSSLQPDIFATVYVPLDVTGRRLALTQATASARQRAAADAESERRDADVEVARAWLHAALTHGALDIARQQQEALREIATVDAARLREGLVAEAVGLRTSLEADRARVTVVAASADALQARTQLARLLGMGEGALPSLARMDAPALPALPDSSAVVALAMRLRPDVQAREAALREAERRAAAERRGLIGDVQLQGGTKETSGFLTGQIGLAVPFPAFNRNDGARQRTSGELAEARVLRDDVRLAAAGSVSAAWHHYAQVRAAAADAATFGARGRDVARIARVAYREGHVTLTELLDAERAASDAMLAQLRWVSDAWMARLELERAIGARLDDAGPLDLPLLSTSLSPGTP
jgi:cobalt-zinc-cadmium efflux system outer membrane protein